MYNSVIGKKIWRLKNSFYIIFAFFSLASVSFFYIGCRVHKKKWILSGFLYLVAIFIPYINMIAYFWGIVRLFKTRKEYLVRLEALTKLGLDVKEEDQLREKVYKEYTAVKDKSNKGTQPKEDKEKIVETLSDNPYVKRIGEYKGRITKAEVKSLLEEIELKCSKIFEYVKIHAESEYKIKQLVNYYLPELFTQMEKYVELAKNSDLNVPNIVMSMKKIESLLPTFIVACNNIYNELFNDSLLDISNDVEVLKSQMYQNGLTGDDEISFNS
jgi:hypothetical protein